MKARYLLAAAGIASLALSSPALATTFFDDWEDTDFGAGSGWAGPLLTYSGWDATNGPGIEIQYNGIAGSPLSGENLVELDSTANSEMTYGTGLDAGVYTLSFWYSDRPGTGAGTNGIDVLLNGSSIYSVVGGVGGANTNWVQQTVNFSAGAGDLLSFAALGTSDSYGGYIEDVSLSAAVPEPGTWLLLLLGFGLVGGAMRATRKRETGPRVRYAF